jgi:hypothetical protein
VTTGGNSGNGEPSRPTTPSGARGSGGSGGKRIWLEFHSYRDSDGKLNFYTKRVVK